MDTPNCELCSEEEFDLHPATVYCMNCSAKDGSPLVNMCDTQKLLHAASLKTKNHTLYDVVSIEPEMKAVAIVKC